MNLFLQFNAAPLFHNASPKLGQSPMGFVEDMVWEAIRQGGTHTEDEIIAARAARQQV